jgi:phage N-6-adenine-methyltransferase
MPAQKPSKSRQDVETPQEFIDAVAARWGKIDVDLACHSRNPKAAVALTWPDVNSLAQDWAGLYADLNCWLNPEYGNVGPWAEKAAAAGGMMRRGGIFMLVPSGTSTQWWAHHVHRKAMVYFLRPKIVFVGEKSSFPKDLTLVQYAPGLSGYDTWRWKGVDR